jgi:phage terminase Nu1 subunit (DNA packaging protein)
MTADQIHCPVKTMAEALNVSPRRVQQLAQGGVIPRATRGRYDFRACINAYCKYLHAQIQERAPDELTRSRMRLLEERTRKLRIEKEAKMARLIRADEARAVMLTFAATIDTCAKALYSRKLAHELAGIHEPAAVRACRQDVSDRLEALIEARQDTLPEITEAVTGAAWHRNRGSVFHCLKQLTPRDSVPP